jgi:toxin ParE1/3/4
VKPVVLQSEAKAELRKSCRWYDKRRAGLGDELLNDGLAALDKIERDNFIGLKFEKTRFRFHRLDRFPYVVYYESLKDHVRVVAIAHERRRPGYWKRRKPE